jgi:phosphoribosylglycinamide formyltransferase 2
MVLGSGELGKEVVIELQRLGIETIAVDRYAGAPAMAVAHRCHVLSMLDGPALRQVIAEERPALVIPEVEAIATDTLAALEAEGITRVVPNPRAVQLTMDREGIRRLAAETLGLATSPYVFADSEDEVRAAVSEVGLPCVIKPVMSSSGHGQSVIRRTEDIAAAWQEAVTGGRAATTGATRVIVEGFVDFDCEITLLTVRHRDGVTFCPPIGHVQVDGDYRESWQPQPLPEGVWERACAIADEVTGALGGWGLFGVELFIRGDEVIFSEVSPRPHDTGLVTLASQDLSEFALHVRACLGFPVPGITSLGPSASCAVIAEGQGVPRYDQVDVALAEPTVQLRIFGKPTVDGHRRVAVAVARGNDIDEARRRARTAAQALTVTVEPVR